MYWSKLFIPTLREGQRVLVRAGYMRGQDYLFLGRRTLSRIVARIRREMDAIGAQEVLIAGPVRAIAAELRSYRQIPQIWYQFAAFSLKTYSFDLDGDAFERMSRALRSISSEYEPAEQTVEDPPGDFPP